MAMVPPEARGKLEPAEIYHEILVHRWYLSERAGHEVDIFETARDYIAFELSQKPEEAVAAVPETGGAGRQRAADHAGATSRLSSGPADPAGREVRVVLADGAQVVALRRRAGSRGGAGWCPRRRSPGCAATSTWPAAVSRMDAEREVTSASTSRVSASRLADSRWSEAIRASQAPK